MFGHLDVFIDESGDLGFTEGKSSRYLVIGATVTSEQYKMGRLTKKARQKLRVKGKTSVEFKFNNSSHELRNYFLEGLVETDSWIFWGAIEKRNTGEDLKRKKDKLYHYICGRVMDDVFKLARCKSIHVIMDNRPNQVTDRNDFRHYLNAKMNEHYRGPFVPALTISQLDSTTVQGLQVHDFVVGSVFRHLEHHDDTYYDIIRSAIKTGREYW